MAGKKPESRDEAGRFKKGQSGNPGGRKPLPPDVKMMLKESSADAAKLLIETMRDKNAKIDLRINCANTIMDRVFGKASQPIDGNIDSVVKIILGGELEELAK